MDHDRTAGDGRKNTTRGALNSDPLSCSPQTARGRDHQGDAVLPRGVSAAEWLRFRSAPGRRHHHHHPAGAEAGGEFHNRGLLELWSW